MLLFLLPWSLVSLVKPYETKERREAGGVRKAGQECEGCSRNLEEWGEGVGCRGGWCRE